MQIGAGYMGNLCPLARHESSSRAVCSNHSLLPAAAVLRHLACSSPERACRGYTYSHHKQTEQFSAVTMRGYLADKMGDCTYLHVEKKNCLAGLFLQV